MIYLELTNILVGAFVALLASFGYGWYQTESEKQRLRIALITEITYLSQQDPVVTNGISYENNITWGQRRGINSLEAGRVRDLFNISEKYKTRKSESMINKLNDMITDLIKEEPNRPIHVFYIDTNYHYNIFSNNVDKLLTLSQGEIEAIIQTYQSIFSLEEYSDMHVEVEGDFDFINSMINEMWRSVEDSRETRDSAILLLRDRHSESPIEKIRLKIKDFR
jgi:hypothetical protein